MSLVSSHVSGSESRRGSTASQHLRAQSLQVGRTSNSQWLIRTVTVAEFCQQIAVMYEHFAINLQSLVETFQQQTLNRDGKSGHRWFPDAWEKLLDQYAVVSKDYFDLAHNLECGVSNALQEATSHKHAVLDDVIHYRDNLWQEIKLKDSNLLKLEKEYCEAWHKMVRDGKVNIKNHNTALCYNKHNDYVLQLTGTNKFNEDTCVTVLPSISKEMERVDGDIAELIRQGIIKHAELTKSKLNGHGDHMDSIISAMQSIDVSQGSVHSGTEKEPKQYGFVKPDHNATGDFVENKLVLNSATEKVLRDKYDTLVREVNELERNLVSGKEVLAKLKKQHDSIKANQQHAKAAEIWKKIYNHKTGLQRSEVSLKGKRAQLQLFTPDILSWKLSNGHAVTSCDHGQVTPKAEQSALSSEDKDSFSDMLHSGRRLHCFQDHTFKKPTFCDHCRGMLKGILKQGLRCKLCKSNVHHKCQEGVTECKGGVVDKKKLLRRQKSSSELEIPRQYESNVEEVDPVYEAIKCAASLSSGSCIDTSPRPSLVPGSTAPATQHSGSSLSGSYSSDSTNSLAPEGRDLNMSKSAPHSPSSASTRRKILETYGKSMSFDTHPSPRQHNEHGRRSEPSIKSHARYSPVHHLRGSVSRPVFRPRRRGHVSVSFADQSSSPSSSERDFVALYNFEGMIRDDLSLRTGDRVHVIDNSGTEWWKGEVNGECGFFPSFCVTSLKPWEQIVKVTHTYKASQDVKDGISLKKNQVVIQTSTEDSGWVHVSTRKQEGVFPCRYLQPVTQPHTT